MKKFDCFTFFNELDLLEFRLRLLDEQVDYFVIVESNLSHAGKNKSYYFKESKHRFAKWQHKIIYHPLVQSTEGLVFKSRNTHDLEDGSWVLENQQRNAIKDVIQPNEDDLIFIGDLDEILDPMVIKDIQGTSQPKAFSMLFHYYFMNCRNVGVEKTWNGTVAVSGRYFNNHTCQHIRDNRNDYARIENGGWHFSYLGGLEKIKQKLQAFAHTEYNKEEFLNDEHILFALEKGLDILKRPDTSYKLFPVFLYPRHLRKLMKQYPKFIKKASTLKWLLAELKEKKLKPDQTLFAKQFFKNLFFYFNCCFVTIIFFD
ncbi:glycosyltransferase family 17 protein [Niabella ginsengisoli]|uniref:Glycosyltransferase family 17 n=1 Tax=Niabella ginsengisoli TaxID=522298 RepID=A0ABS9SMU5_9BACT|nr:hypothetical protein [Niabella ginsengisoli]MCH5599700.1 hypothetical protein [Niabella ginsengisoli]